MRLFLVFLVAILLFGCSNPKKNNLLTEQEIYSLVNTHVFKDHLGHKDVIISVYQTEETSLSRELIESATNDSIQNSVNLEVSKPDLNSPSPPPPRWLVLSENKWEIDKLDNLKFVDDDTINVKELEMHGIKKIHHLSPVLYNPDYKIALVTNKITEYDIWNCEPITNFYLYIKKDNTWQSLKEYGTDAPYLILDRYKRNVKYKDE